MLPLGGRHSHALENLEKNVPRKLEKNIKLKNALSFGMSNINLVNDKTLGASLCFPLETEKIERLFNFITRALCYHHFQKLVPDDLQIRVLLLSEFGDNFFNEIFSKIPSNAEHHALGDGTFEYRCISSVPPKDISVWQFKIYGGVYLGGDPNAPNDISTTVGAFVGNPDFLEQLNL